VVCFSIASASADATAARSRAPRSALPRRHDAVSSIDEPVNINGNPDDVLKLLLADEVSPWSR